MTSMQIEQSNWTEKEWQKYHSFLADEFIKEDAYMAEYILDMEANY